MTVSQSLTPMLTFFLTIVVFVLVATVVQVLFDIVAIVTKTSHWDEPDDDFDDFDRS